MPGDVWAFDVSILYVRGMTQNSWGFVELPPKLDNFVGFLLPAVSDQLIFKFLPMTYHLLLGYLSYSEFVLRLN